MSSIKKNFLYSSILTVSNYIFPFLTFPYISRVLGVGNIGVCNFVDSIINYFVLFSSLGISIVGIREIAKAKNNTNNLNRTFTSLLTINLITTLLMIALLLLCIQIVPTFHEHSKLLYVGAFKLLGNFLLIEWLFKGLEDFKYITMRSICVKTFFVVSVFLFVQEKEDYFIYYILMTCMTVINCSFNCYYARKFVHFDFKNLTIKPYLISIVVLGLYMILTSMYTSFNVAFLGFSSGTVEVGYYTTATKIYGILLSIFTAFTGVMLPRMSSLLNDGKIEEFRSLLQKSIKILVYFSLPVILMSEFFAPEIIKIISGDGYEGAILPMRIVMPLMLIIGYEQIIIIQGLMPLGKDKAITINSLLGASIGLVLNMLIVPSLHSVGSAIVWLCSELVVLSSSQFFIHKFLGINFPYKIYLKNIIYYLPLGFIIFILLQVDCNSMIIFFISSILCILYFILIHVIWIKDDYVLAFLLKVKENLVLRLKL